MFPKRQLYADCMTVWPLTVFDILDGGKSMLTFYKPFSCSCHRWSGPRPPRPRWPRWWQVLGSWRWGRSPCGFQLQMTAGLGRGRLSAKGLGGWWLILPQKTRTVSKSRQGARRATREISCEGNGLSRGPVERGKGKYERTLYELHEMEVRSKVCMSWCPIMGCFLLYLSIFSNKIEEKCLANEELSHIENCLNNLLWLAVSRFSFWHWKLGGTVNNLKDP